MDKEEIIKAIENLYERLYDVRYSLWRESNEDFHWHNSYEFRETEREFKECEELIAKIRGNGD